MRYTNPLSLSWTSLFLPRPWSPRIDPSRMPPTFPTSESPIRVNEVLGEVFAGTAVGGIFFPQASDLQKFINPTFFAPQNPIKGERLPHYMSGDSRPGRISECIKKLLGDWFKELELDKVVMWEGIPAYVWEDANAYTDNNVIYSATGQYDPYSVEGIALIAHELVHYRQYVRYGNLPMKLGYLKSALRNGASRANPYEKEAYDMQEAIYKSLTDMGYGKINPCRWDSAYPIPLK